MTTGLLRSRLSRSALGQPADGPGPRAVPLPPAPTKPVIGFVGIHSGGRPDQPVSQNETLAALFADSGYEVRRTSAVRHRVLRTAHQIWSILTWRRVDLLVIAVFSGTSFWIADFSTFLGRLTGKRCVLFLHGGNLPVFGPAHEARVRRVFDRADLILAPSDYLAGTFREWGYDARIIPNVLDIHRYEYHPRAAARPRLLWMRTFHPHYDPKMAVRVFARVLAEYPDASMTMAGADQGLFDETVAEARDLGVLDHIEFPGYIQAATKREVFAAHDLYLNTNVIDNMPVSLLEASACGLVPVATAVGGIPALVTDGVDGVLVETGDVDAMSAEVLSLLGDPERFASMSAGARRLAERSSWPAVRELWIDEFTLLLPSRRLR